MHDINFHHGLKLLLSMNVLLVLIMLFGRFYITSSFHRTIPIIYHSKLLTYTKDKLQRTLKQGSKVSFLHIHKSKSANDEVTKNNINKNKSITTSTLNDNGHTTSINPIFAELNESQLKAVTSPINKISCVIAGPGAGKTRVLTSRIAYLLEKSQKDADQKQILAVTFTKKASNEMKIRLSTMINSDKEQHRVSIGTFHSICAKILRLHGKLLPTLPYIQEYTHQDDREKDKNNIDSTSSIDGTFVILDTSDQLKIIKNIIKRDNLLDDQQTNKQDSNSINHNQILNHISKITMQRLEELLSLPSSNDKKIKSKPNPNEILAQQIHSSYLHELFMKNTLDFDHLINLTLLLLNQYPALQALLQNQYRHILVDEFQDTSIIQFHLIKLLSTKSLMVVGDADQSIYSWRGAYASAMYDFIREWEDVQTFYLMENYRSTKNIILAAQKIINANDNQALPSSSDISISDANKELRKNMVPMKGKGPPPRILSFKDSDEEAEFVVQNVFKLIESNQLSSTSTVAVIYRTNAQSRTIEERCVANRLRYRVRGAAGKFYSRAEIKDSLCFLRLLSNGNDRQALLRAINTPKGRGIGASTMKEFWMYCDYMKRKRFNGTVLDILLTLSNNDDSSDNNTNKKNDDKTILSKRSYNNLSSFANEMRTFMDSIDQSKILLPDLFSSIISFWEVKKQIQSLSKSNSDFDNRWSNVMELGIGLEKYRKDGPCMTSLGEESLSSSSLLSRFLDDIALLEDESDDDTVEGADGDAASNIIVNLMTIHAAKGMEFDVVFLIGNEDGIFPTSQAMAKGSNSPELEEERRLCYVAMTRAKEFLFLTWRKEVRMFFSKKDNDGDVTVRTTDMKRSRFLDTLINAVGKKRKKKSDTTTTVLEKKKKKKKLLMTSTTSSHGISDSPRVRSNVKQKTRAISSNGISDRQRVRNNVKQKSKAIEVPVRQQLNLNTSNILKKRMKDSRDEIMRKSSSSNETKMTNLNSSDILRKRMEQTVKKQYPDLLEGGSTPAKTTSSNDKRKNKSDEIMNSTFFYPVGSSVIHRIHGIGTILESPPSDKNDIVLVKFEKNGLKLTFPLLNNGLKRRYPFTRVT